MPYSLSHSSLGLQLVMMKGCSGKSLEGGIGFSRAAVAVSAVLQMLSDSWTSPVEAG